MHYKSKGFVFARVHKTVLGRTLVKPYSVALRLQAFKPKETENKSLARSKAENLRTNQGILSKLNNICYRLMKNNQLLLNCLVSISNSLLGNVPKFL